MRRTIDFLWKNLSFPTIITLVSFFLIDIDLHIKLIMVFIILSIYFFIMVIFNYSKLEKTENENRKIIEERDSLLKEVEGFNHFKQKRELFINHDLEEISELIKEYNGYVSNAYRGKKFVQLRYEANSVKNQTVVIIKKEKRDFDEQLSNLPSNKNN